MSTEPQPLPTPSYPAIEGFIEKASAEQVATLFADLKDQLAAIKGPKVEHAKKAGRAIELTEMLVSHLIQVREKIETGNKSR